MGTPATIFPVCRGVGENRAVDLMQRFHSLDEIYQNLDTLDIRDSLRQKLVNGRGKALLSRELGTICKTAPVDTGMQAYAMMRAADTAGLAQLLTRLEFSTAGKAGAGQPDADAFARGEPACSGECRRGRSHKRFARQCQSRRRADPSAGMPERSVYRLLCCGGRRNSVRFGGCAGFLTACWR